MPKNRWLVAALVVQLLAQAFGGVWGAAVGGLLIGVTLREHAPFRVGFVAAAVAAAALLAGAMMRGAPLLTFADMIGANFTVPGAALLALSVLFPAVQSGGIAGGVGRLLAGK